MLTDVKKNIAKELSKITGISIEILLENMETPREGFGDLSSKVAFLVAKEKKENPVKLAADILKKIGNMEFISKVESTGPYINFYFSDSFYAHAIVDVLKKDFGKGKKQNKKILVEFPSVNPNKPWHIGHLRNALLGDSVSRVLEFSGFEVERMDYIDDLGLQVAQSLWGYMVYLNSPKKKVFKKFDHFIGEEYVKTVEMIEKNKEIMEPKIREFIKLMEEGKENETTEAWKLLVDQCVKAQYETSFNFGIFHDVLIYESSIINNIFQEGLDFLKKNKTIVKETEGKNAGCWVVKLGEKFANLTDPDKILIRSDGTATYTGKDVIFQLWKLGKLKKDFIYCKFIDQPNGKTAFKTCTKGKKMDFGKVEKVINVIGVEQKYPQSVIVEVFKKLGYEKEAGNSIHLAYEQVWLPDVKFSGREGTWIGFTADDLFEESKNRVKEKIKGDMNEAEKEFVAKIVGLGAIKFSFLHPSSDKKITFDWDHALSFEGGSGPYIQYAAVRTNGIMKKVDFKSSISDKYEFNEHERKIIRMLLDFEQVTSRSAKELTVSHLADYLLHCANSFNKFYSSCPVLTAEKEAEKKARLLIVEATNKILVDGLALLGIEVPEKM